MKIITVFTGLLQIGLFVFQLVILYYQTVLYKRQTDITEKQTQHERQDSKVKAFYSLLDYLNTRDFFKSYLEYSDGVGLAIAKHENEFEINRNVPEHIVKDLRLEIDIALKEFIENTTNMICYQYLKDIIDLELFDYSYLKVTVGDLARSMDKIGYIKDNPNSYVSKYWDNYCTFNKHPS